MSKFEIYPVDDIQRQTVINRKESGGYLTKFWIDHPQLGRSLVKLDESTAPGWSEKVAYELALLLKLPAARYELGVYQDRQAISISPDFKSSKLTYINGDTLIRNSVESYQYNVANSFKALELNRVELPSDYQPPQGISDGADLFVGYLMLDALVANNDRHGANWEIAIDNRGNKTLAPVYDNGASFGVDFGSLVYDNKTPQEYSQTIVSMFGVITQEAFKSAAIIRPKAAEIWKLQLNQIDRYKIQDLFNRIPKSLITAKAKQFALELIDNNQKSLLDINTPVLPAPSTLRQQYLDYQNNLNITLKEGFGRFEKMVQQEKEDLAIARQIVREFDGNAELAFDKMNAILSYSDRVLTLKKYNQFEQSDLYRQNIFNRVSTKSRKGGLDPSRGFEI